MSIVSKMEKSQIEFLLKDGNDSTIANQFGITRQSIYKIRKKFQIPSARSRVSPKRKQIVELRRERVSVSKIAAITGTSQSYVYKILRSEERGSRINPPDKNIE